MRCPICGRPTESAWRPFCSRRCADLDLAHWFDGTYTVPLEETEDETDETAAPFERDG